MNEAVVISATNLKGRRDATGAFLPWGRLYARLYSSTAPVELNMATPIASRFAVSTEAIRALPEGTTALAFFGHGYTSGLQLGYRGIVGMSRLGALLNAKGITQLRLYACSFGGGAAMRWLMDAAPSLQLIAAHATAGHTACNPYVVYLSRALGEPVFATDGAREYGDPLLYRRKMGYEAIRKGPHAFPLEVMRQDPANVEAWRAFWEGVR